MTACQNTAIIAIYRLEPIEKERDYNVFCIENKQEFCQNQNRKNTENREISTLFFVLYACPKFHILPGIGFIHLSCNKMTMIPC